MLKRVLLALACILLLAPGLAVAGPLSPAVAPPSCPYIGGGDNGCAGSQAYVQQPAFIDPNTLVDSAETGQLPTNATPAQTATRVSWARSAGVNYAGVDYAIGSAAPATLAPVSNFVDPTGACVYYAYGAPDSGGTKATNTGGTDVTGGAFIQCQAFASNQVETIQGYDFTNTGGGTGTDCVSIYVKNSPTATNVRVNIVNDYFQLNLSPAGSHPMSGTLTGNTLTTTKAQYWLPGQQITGGLPGNMLPAGTTVTGGSGTSWTVSNSGSITGGTFYSPEAYCWNTFSFIHFASAGTGHPVNTVQLTNVTADGNLPLTYYNSCPNCTASSTTGAPYYYVNSLFAKRQSIVVDDRTGGALPPNHPYQWSIGLMYVWCANLGHNCLRGANGGTLTAKFSYVRNDCLSGINYCHGEVSELNGGLTSRSDVYEGVTYIVDGVYQPLIPNGSQGQAVATTTAFYLTSGNSNNTIEVNPVLRNNLVVINKTGCTNAPGQNNTPMTWGGYGPNNPCVGGVINGSGLFSTNFDQYVTNLTVIGNVIDGTGSYNCYINNHYNANGTSSSGSNSMVAQVQSAGSVFTITTPGNYGSGYPTYNLGGNLIAIGTILSDSSKTDIANGWVDTFVTGTADGSASCAVAGANGFAATCNFTPAAQVGPGVSFTPGPAASCAGSSCTFTNIAPTNDANCTPGTYAGCGTLRLNDAEPVTTSGHSYDYYAGIYGLAVGNNWSIGGAWGTNGSARVLAFPPAGSSSRFPNSIEWGGKPCP